MGLGPCGKRFVGIRRVLVVLAACAAAAGAQAAGSIASLALDSLSTSVGVSSQSISGVVSSGSSGRDKVAQGPYRIQALVRQPDADGDERRWVWVGLDPVGEAAPWTLRLPAPVADGAGLAVGQVLEVRHRDYGLGLWPAGGGAALYLIVDDALARGWVARPLDAASTLR